MNFHNPCAEIATLLTVSVSVSFLARLSAFLFSLIILPVFKTVPSESKVVFIAQDQYALH